MKTEQEDSQERESAIRQGTTVGDLVVCHPQLRPTLEKLGIDYCCGGKKALSDAAEEAGMEWPTVLASLEEALERRQEDGEDTDWSNASLSALADHILDKHHAFTKAQLPRLDALLAKVQKAHGVKHGDMLSELRHVYDSLRSELEEHLMKEEQILFPAIKGIDAFMSRRGERPIVHCGSIANPIRQMVAEHENAGEALAQMRSVTRDYALPEDACPTFRALFDGLREMEADLHEHIHLENNILFPRAEAVEAQG